MKRHAVWLCAVLVAVASYAQETVVATIGREKVTVQQIDEQMRLMGVSGYTSFGNLPADQQRSLLERIVAERLFYRAAIDERVKLDPENEKRLDFVRRQVFGWQYVENKLKAAQVTDAELKIYYDQHKTEFERPEARRISHIVVATKEEAEKALADLRAGKDLADLAGQLNIDQTRQNRGAIGWVRRHMLPEEFEKEVFSLKQGEFSGIVDTGAGFHIVRVDEIRPAASPPFEEVRPQVEQRYDNARVEKMEEQLRTKYRVTITLPSSAAQEDARP